MDSRKTMYEDRGGTTPAESIKHGLAWSFPKAEVVFDSGKAAVVADLF